MVKGNKYFLQTCFSSLLEADWSLLPSRSREGCCSGRPSVCGRLAAWLSAPELLPGQGRGSLCPSRERKALPFFSTPIGLCVCVCVWGECSKNWAQCVWIFGLVLLRTKWSKSSQVPEFLAEHNLIQILTWGTQTLGEHAGTTLWQPFCCSSLHRSALGQKCCDTSSRF